MGGPWDGPNNVPRHFLWASCLSECWWNIFSRTLWTVSHETYNGLSCTDVTSSFRETFHEMFRGRPRDVSWAAPNMNTHGTFSEWHVSQNLSRTFIWRPWTCSITGRQYKCFIKLMGAYNMLCVSYATSMMSWTPTRCGERRFSPKPWQKKKNVMGNGHVSWVTLGYTLGIFVYMR